MRIVTLFLLSASACFGQTYELRLPTLEDICFVVLPQPGSGASSTQFCGGTLDIVHYYELVPFQSMWHSSIDVSFDFTGSFTFPNTMGNVVLELTETPSVALPTNTGFVNSIWELTPDGNGAYLLENQADIIAGFADITLQGTWDDHGFTSHVDDTSVGVIGSFNDDGVAMDISDYPNSVTLSDNRDFLQDFSGTFNTPLGSDFYLNRMYARDLNLGRSITLTKVGTLSADANNDDIVDGHDFLIWNAYKFTMVNGGPSMGDFDRDGEVDGDDFLIWNTQKFADLRVLAVPEAAGLWALIVTLLLVWNRRCHFR